MPTDAVVLTTRPDTFAQPIPAATAWLLADCMEMRGKQDLWQARKPEVLRTLRERAIVQSVESSNRIEGVIVPAERLRPLVRGKARPRDRPEQDLQGYRRALDRVLGKGHAAPVDARLIRHLHALAQQGAGDAGEFKRRDNEIVELLPRGGRRVRFVPTSAKQTPRAIDLLCDAYDALDGACPPLLLVASVVFDFLCIHPFRDGNGRVARLLTTLLLERNGFAIARFVSLERLIEQERDGYYDTLRICSESWHEGRNTIAPWWNYLLAIIRRAYAELGDEVRSASVHSTKSDLVRRAVEAQIAPFTLAEIRAAVPEASDQLVRKVLIDMKRAKLLRGTGHGRGARWVRVTG